MAMHSKNIGFEAMHVDLPGLDRNYILKLLNPQQDEELYIYPLISQYNTLNYTVCIKSDNTFVELSSLPQDTYVACSLMKDNHVYFFSRYDVPKKKNGYVNLGFIVDYNIADDSMRNTPLTIKNKSRDCIVFFPVMENQNSYS